MISLKYLSREIFQSNEAKLELLVGDVPGNPKVCGQIFWVMNR